MSDILTPDSLDLRLDRAASDLRAEEPEAIERVVVRTRPAPRKVARPTTVRLRYAAGALTVLLAGAAIWPHGEASQAQAAMTFERVQAATRAAPHSIARSYGPDGRFTGYTVWREGEKYATTLLSGDGKRLMSETRSDGNRMLHSWQWMPDAKAPGYRFATLDKPFLRIEQKFDTLAGILESYDVRGPEPTPVRVGDRLRYRIHPVWSKTETVLVEADAATGRVLELRGSAGGRTVLDYRTPISPTVFIPRPTVPGLEVIDFDRLRPILAADLARESGAWLDGDGTLWRVYRGGITTPPAIPGLDLKGRRFSKKFERDGVIAVGSKLRGSAPREVEMKGKRVPVRRIGMMVWWSGLFGPGGQWSRVAPKPGA